MNQAQRLEGKIMHHPFHGKVRVCGAKENSRVKVNIEVIDRGPGWNERKQKYTGVKTLNGWFRGQNREYGTIHETHIENLKPLVDH